MDRNKNIKDKMPLQAEYRSRSPIEHLIGAFAFKTTMEDLSFSELISAVNKYRDVHGMDDVEIVCIQKEGTWYARDTCLVIAISDVTFISPQAFTLRRMFRDHDNSYFLDKNGTGWANRIFIDKLISDRDYFDDTHDSTMPKNIKKAKTYLIKDDKTGYTKIGRSFDPKQREKTFLSDCPTLRLIAVSELNVEKQLHKDYSSKRKRGEWFDLSNKEIESIIKTHSFNAILSLGIDLKELGK
jgi:hypothetical protein